MSDSFIFSIIFVIAATHYCKVYSVKDSKSHLLTIYDGLNYLYFKLTKIFKQLLVSINDILRYHST